MKKLRSITKKSNSQLGKPPVTDGNQETSPSLHLKPPSYTLKFILLILAFILTFTGSFLLGRYHISFHDFTGMLIAEISSNFRNLAEVNMIPNFMKHLFHTLASAIDPVHTWNSAEEVVFFNIRMPRVLAASVIGAALASAGASYQGMFRNPMVSPDILGASSGAGFGAALGILLYFNYVGITLSAFLFGISAVLLAYFISRVSPLDGILAMVLSGMIISSLFSACTSYVKLIADTDNILPAITYWLMGSLTSIKQVDFLFVLIPVTIGIIPLMFLRWRINLLTLSEEEAKSLGVNTKVLRIVVIICATLMTSASVSVSGMIGWIGLIIPHFCRMIFGYDYRRLLPASALFGATFLLIVDNIARNITTSEVPIGILTSFVGAPVFLYLILSKGKNNEY